MPHVAPTVWTTRRKVMGNLIPTAFWFPMMAIGVGTMLVQRQILGPGLVFLLAAPVVGWLSLNRFGLFENRKMATELEKILSGKGDTLPAERVFVGFASPKFSGTLDAHEDVGFLCFKDDTLVFLSETRLVTIPRETVTEIRFRSNPHTVLALGRFISVDATSEGKPIRMLVEPRVHRTMLANRRESSKLIHRLTDWKNGQAIKH